MNPDAVIKYLNENPNFLDNYILTSVSTDRIQCWADRSNRINRQNSLAESNSSNNGEHFQSQLVSQNKDQKKWKAPIERKKLIEDLTRDIHQHTDKSSILLELTNCISSAIEADSCNLFLVSSDKKEIYPCNKLNNWLSPVPPRHKIGSNTILAAYVANTQECFRSNHLLPDERFPEGVGSGQENVRSVLSYPLVQSSELLGVVEFYRHADQPQFTDNDDSVIVDIITTGELILRVSEIYHSMAKQRKLNEFLLTVTKSIFQDIVSMDIVIMKIMNYAQRLVSADRASLFLVDNTNKQLYARIFDVGNGPCASGSAEVDSGSDVEKSATRTEIRFPMNKGVAGHVASTGEILNIPDAYAYDNFNRSVDLQTGYRTKSILCMPIYIRGNIIGVVQMVNKLEGTFTKADEESFETFAIYCGLALHHAKLYDKIRRSEQKHKVALEVLTYHSQAQLKDVQALKQKPIPEKIPDLTTYSFSPWGVPKDDKALYVIYMFKDLFNMTSNQCDEDRFDINHLFKFTLTVRKNYRDVPYHNWAHAFSVAHAMYTIIKTGHTVFTPLECLALYVACLCHDVDHRGYTNTFLVKNASPLAAIYSTSVMEHHHFNHTITILQNEGHNIFRHLTSSEYKQVLGDIKHCILATDLALFFTNKAKLTEALNQGEFSWERKDHRRIGQAITMTSCDLVASIKPWSVQLDTVKVIFEEFYAQGDEEKAKGHNPIPMMDREKSDQLPESQVGFLVGICLPCYELLEKIIPETQPMVIGARANLEKWKQLAEEQKSGNKRFSLFDSQKDVNETEREENKNIINENNTTAISNGKANNSIERTDIESDSSVLDTYKSVDEDIIDIIINDSIKQKEPGSSATINKDGLLTMDTIDEENKAKYEHSKSNDDGELTAGELHKNNDKKQSSVTDLKDLSQSPDVQETDNMNANIKTLDTDQFVDSESMKDSGVEECLASGEHSPRVNQED